MSRTTRTLPRWVTTQITHRNNYVNGYRGDELTSGGYSCDTDAPYVWARFHGNKCSWSKANEYNAWQYSTDNGARCLRFCRNSVSHGKGCGWMMSEASSTLAKRGWRKQWARANRQVAKDMIREQMDDENCTCPTDLEPTMKVKYSMAEIDDYYRQEIDTLERAIKNAYENLFKLQNELSHKRAMYSINRCATRTRFKCGAA